MSREPTEMELRVAEAVEVCMRENAHKHINTWAKTMPPLLTRAAIRAMRDMTPIVHDHEGFPAHELRGDPENIWRAMIDAASPSGPGE